MLPRSEDVVIREGRGSHLISVDGREYIDYLMGSRARCWSVIAIRESWKPSSTRFGRGTTFYFLNEPAIRLAEQVIEAVPCAEQVRYVTTGSDATFLIAARGAGVHGPAQDPEVRRWLAWDRRLRNVRHRAG